MDATNKALMWPIAPPQEDKQAQITKGRLDRFRAIAQKLKTIATGATIPGARIMDSIDWKESFPCTLTIDNKPYTGTFITNAFQYENGSYIQDWEQKKNQENIPFRSLYSFEEYMNQLVIPALSLQQKQQLEQYCQKSVEYYTPTELQTLQAEVAPNGRLFLTSPTVQAWSELPENRMSYRRFLQVFPARSCTGTYYLRKTQTPYIYVLTTDHTLYVHIKQRGSTQHSSITGGKAVLSAGLLEVDEDGRITKLLPQSGHYKPENTQIITMLEYLSNKGIDVDTINITRANAGKKGREPIEVTRGHVKNWMKTEKASILQKLQMLVPSICLETAAQKAYRYIEHLVKQEQIGQDFAS